MCRDVLALRELLGVAHDYLGGTPIAPTHKIQWTEKSVKHTPTKQTGRHAYHTPPTKQNGYLPLCVCKLTVIVITSKSPHLEFVCGVFDRLYQENWLEQWATKKVNGTGAEEVGRCHVSVKYCMMSHTVNSVPWRRSHAKLYGIWPEDHFISPQPSRVWLGITTQKSWLASVEL